MRGWLVEIRERSRKSQYVVARETGLSQSYYASIESGTRGNKLPVHTAKKIAQVLGFHWQRFYEEQGESAIEAL